MPQALDLDAVIRFERKWINARRSQGNLKKAGAAPDPAPMRMRDLQGHFRKLADAAGDPPRLTVELAAEAEAKRVAQAEVLGALEAAVGWFYEKPLPDETQEERAAATAMTRLVWTMLVRLRRAAEDPGFDEANQLGVLIARAHVVLQHLSGTVHACTALAERRGREAAIAHCSASRYPVGDQMLKRFRRSAEDAGAASLRLIAEVVARSYLDAWHKQRAGAGPSWLARQLDSLSDTRTFELLAKHIAGVLGREEAPPETTTAEQEPEALQGLGSDTRFRAVIETLGGTVAERMAADLGARPQDGVVGLALSGGGVRSASFNLGVLQALYEIEMIDKVDYLSTVSGGGYVGSCVSSIYGGGAQAFPFDHNPGEPENRAFKHLRNHSNYLAPGGFLDWARIVALLLRSTLANFLIVFPLILLAAMATVLAINAETPLSQEIEAGWGHLVDWLIPGAPWLAVAAVWLGTVVSMVTVASLPFTSAAAWALAVSFVMETVSRTRKEWRTWHARNRLGRISAWLLIATGVLFVIEIQPYIVETYGLRQYEILLDTLTLFVTVAGPVLAFLSSRIAQRAPVQSVLRRLPYILVGVLGPLIIYLVFLVLARWGAFPETAPAVFADVRLGMAHLIVWATGVMASAWSAFDGWRDWAELQLSLMTQVAWRPAGQVTTAALYGLVAAVMFALMARFGNVNLSSPHMFYRDRLARAFVFRVGATGAVEANDEQSLAALVEQRPGPYHLINATLNLTTAREDPTKAPTNGNRAETPGVPAGAWARRSADFFLFSPGYSGSVRTGYCRTAALEQADRHLGLATAMAISGAAAAPFSGVVTNRALAFLMVLFNIRLGYWVPSPTKVGAIRRKWARLLLGDHSPGPFYLYLELFGLVDDTRRCINVSDGGHIENLGIYELLRRRCPLIVASDAEHDPNYSFAGLARLQMMARVDMGIDIQFNPDDFKAIREARDGGHAARPFAVGVIRYSNGDTGRLIYLKSCVTGAERAYIRSYREQNKDFPHQSTGDQFFDETQFECYRGLGYSLTRETFSSPYEEIPSQEAGAADARERTRQRGAFPTTWRHQRARHPVRFSGGRSK